jgi:hypothetical protein
MADDGKTIYLRLSLDTAEKLERLTAEFPGLPRTLLLRLLMHSLLDRPLGEQVSAVERQIRGASPEAACRPERCGRGEDVDGRNGAGRRTELGP